MTIDRVNDTMADDDDGARTMQTCLCSAIERTHTHKHTPYAACARQLQCNYVKLKIYNFHGALVF